MNVFCGATRLVLVLAWAAVAFVLPVCAEAVDAPASARFQTDAQPILKEFCYDCHGDGMNKGQVAFDEFKSHDELLGKRELWLSVLKNLRAGLMPPEKKPRPSPEQRLRLENWILREGFGLDPANPDPGRVTLHRLNRVEYRNTIRDLTGFDYKVEEELPPDDAGYGFDNIGDVLTLSPLLLEKYMQAAETVAAIVPRVTRTVAETNIPGSEFHPAGGKGTGEKLSFYEPVIVARTFQAEHAGTYQLQLEFQVSGQFDFDPGRCRVAFKVDDRMVWTNEFGWQNGKRFTNEVSEVWEPGERRLALELEPLTLVEKKKNALDLRLTSVRVRGPLEEKHWVRPKHFELFFSKDPPESPGARRSYAREVLERFATRAYRRPVDQKTVDRLLAMAESVSSQPGGRFEDGIAEAIVPVLASPRFLFRIEETEPDRQRRTHPAVDEYALASRLSYFLWSTMPDDGLFRLASRRELRQNLGAQTQRMLADARAQALIENFVGQWLQVRDVEGIDINSRAVLARESGAERGLESARRRLVHLRDLPEDKLTPEEKAELKKLFEERRHLFGRPTLELDRDLRRALREETEMAFAHTLREDRSVLELIDCDYTFLNERLAKHYGLTNLNVSGPEMRRVTLPPGHARGGVLTHGSVLIVTSNPTRTSPVKRGLFVLDNILGMPPPPPPANVPQLEEAEKEFAGREPSLREVLEVHRRNALCSSCHSRMDPLGLALENFNALGLWREKERGQAIVPEGKLITGETFADIRDVKRVLVTHHRQDFYRCLTEKLLTYALGRGLEYYDVAAVDEIVARLERENGRFSALLSGVVESAPFQKRRGPAKKEMAENN